MKEYPLVFAIQEVPEDGFNPDGPSVFRGVARVKALDIAYVVTGVYVNAEDCVAQLAELLRDGAWKISSLNHDLGYIEKRNLVDRDAVYDIARTLVKDHLATYKHKQ